MFTDYELWPPKYNSDLMSLMEPWHLFHLPYQVSVTDEDEIVHYCSPCEYLNILSSDSWSPFMPFPRSAWDVPCGSTTCRVTKTVPIQRVFSLEFPVDIARLR